jgi:hypothetical protein
MMNNVFSNPQLQKPKSLFCHQFHCSHSLFSFLSWQVLFITQKYGRENIPISDFIRASEDKTDQTALSLEEICFQFLRFSSCHVIPLKVTFPY